MAIKYTNSKLIDLTILSPNHYTGRTCGYARHEEGIYITTPHCMAYDGSIETCGNDFKDPARNASSNYGIDSKGRRGLYVEEKNASWCSSNRENDMHAITVEIACERPFPYKMTDKAIESYIELTVDVMKRYGLDKLLYLGSLEETRAYIPKRKSNEMLMTLHRWYAAENGKPKACPGDYFISKIPYIVSEINKRFKPEPKPQTRLGKLTVIDSSVDVREKPDKSSQLYKIKKKGEVINVVALVGKWYLTMNGNYVYKDSRVEYKQSACEAFFISNIYEKPNTSSKKLIKVPMGTKMLSIMDNGTGWTKVWYNGMVGYVKNFRLKHNSKLSVYPEYKVKSDVWLRTKASTLPTTKTKIKLKAGDKLQVVCDYNKKFYQVFYNDKEYFALKSKLENCLSN